MTLHSCPVCLAKVNGVKMKEHLRSRHPKYVPGAGAASRASRAAAPRDEEWVACGECSHAARTRGELIRHVEQAHMRGGSPHELRMSLGASEDVRAIKAELKRTAKDCGWMEHMYVDKTINRCKGVVGKPYMQQVGRGRVRVTKLCPASILIEPAKTEFKLTFYNRHVGHDWFTYKPTALSADFIVSKEKKGYEKLLKILDTVKRCSSELSEVKMKPLLKKAEEMEEYLNSVREPEPPPIEEVMITDVGVYQPPRKRKLQEIKAVIPDKSDVEKAVDEALEKYIQAKNPIVKVKSLNQTRTPLKKTNIPIQNMTPAMTQIASPKIVNTFTIEDEDLESFTNEVELLVNNGRSFEAVEQRNKLGKANAKEGVKKLKTDAQKVNANVNESDVKTNGRKSSIVDEELKSDKTDAEDGTGPITKVMEITKVPKMERMTTRKQSITQPLDIDKVYTGRLSLSVKKLASPTLTEKAKVSIDEVADTKPVSGRMATRKQLINSNIDDRKTPTPVKLTVSPSAVKRPIGTPVAKLPVEPPAVKRPFEQPSAKRPVEQPATKRPVDQPPADAKAKKATEDEGNRLANETIKLGDDIVRVRDLVDVIASPKKKVDSLFTTSSFSDSYKEFISKEFKVQPTGRKVQKKSLSLEITADGINQSNKQIPDDLKDMVKIKRGRPAKLKDDTQAEFSGEEVHLESESKNVTNDMLIQMLSETDSQLEPNNVRKKGRPSKDSAVDQSDDFYKKLLSTNDRIVMVDKTSPKSGLASEAKRTKLAGVKKTGLKTKYPISKARLRAAAGKVFNKGPKFNRDELESEEQGIYSDSAASDSDNEESPESLIGKSKGAAAKVVEEKFIVKERDDDCNILIIRM